MSYGVDHTAFLCSFYKLVDLVFMVGYSRENASFCACGQAHQSGFYREELFQHANGKYVAFLRGRYALSAVSFARS